MTNETYEPIETRQSYQTELEDEYGFNNPNMPGWDIDVYD